MSYTTPYIARFNSGKPPEKQLPSIPFHGLHHTSATLLIASKQDVRTVSARLGHAQASRGMSQWAERNFIPSSMQLEHTGITL